MHPTGKSTKPILSQILLTVRSRASSKNTLEHKLLSYQETAAEPWCTSCSPPPSSIQSQLFPVALQRQNDLKLLPKCCSATTVFLGMPRHRASAIKLLTPSSSPFTRCHLLQSAPRQIPHGAQGAASHPAEREAPVPHPSSGRAAGMSSPASSTPPFQGEHPSIWL